MKEYIAETGGRYTYSDDILNLQELALSLTAIFDGCSNFVISGCEVNGNEITSGYIWLNGKVRYFSGIWGVTFPYYLVEDNSTDTVVYANDVNKKGRYNYLCIGDTNIPYMPDPVTLLVPQYITVNPSYTPRLIDQFIGKYAVLLESPFSKQTIKKDVIFAGTLTGEKDIISKTALSVVNPSNGYTLKNVVKPSGDGSVGLYVNGLLVNEIILSTDGSFQFLKQNKEIARVSEEGFQYTHSVSTTSQTGSIFISGYSISNIVDDSDAGSIDVNINGYERGNTKYRDFRVYDGKNTIEPILHIEGKTQTAKVKGLLTIRNEGNGIELVNSTYLKGNSLLTNLITWKDTASEIIAFIGYGESDTFDFTLKNTLGNIVLHPKEWLDIKGELKINGKGISSLYVSMSDFANELNKKVDSVSGKQLSTEDFTTIFKEKLEGINPSKIGNSDAGYVTAKDVTEALSKKLSIASNLSDLNNKQQARVNLEVYSISESRDILLKKESNLLELVTLTADEVNGLTTEQITAKKEQKQATVRNNIDAEKKGTGDLKLAKASNLSDLPDKAQARKNISVYSTQEIDQLLQGKISNEDGYVGAIFTQDHKTKLDGIKTGNFSGIEGYVLSSAVKTELGKKANLLLDNYNSSQKITIAGNLGVYTKTDSDGKFATFSSLFQDYINYQVTKQGKTTQQAQQALRDKLNCPSKEDVTSSYVRKDGKLADLVLANADAKKTACRSIGAAYADDYQTKLTDTGWLQMGNTGNTDTSRLYIRQIGNIVCIQGIVNTGRRNGSNNGGTVGVIPNQVLPPKYAVYTMATTWNDGHQYNRGVSFKISANSRNITIQESGFNNLDTEVSFTYMT